MADTLPSTSSPSSSQGTRPVARQARGERRRRVILDATLRVISREGVAGVTHRAVAAEAGVPLAATTYYFASKQELLLEAFRLHTEIARQRLQRVRKEGNWRAAAPADVAGGVIDSVASLIADDLTEGRNALVAEYELMLEASRRPELRELAQGWHDEVLHQMALGLERLGSRDPAGDAFLVQMVYSGLEIDAVSRGHAHAGVDGIRRTLERLVTALLTAPPTARDRDPREP